MVTSGIHDRQYAPAENHVGKDVQNLNKGEIECNLWNGILAYRKNLEARVGFEPASRIERAQVIDFMKRQKR